MVALKEYSKGAVPCILAHMLIDSLAVLMLVQSSLPQIILLVIFEILVASWLVALRESVEIGLYLFAVGVCASLPFTDFNVELHKMV